MRKIVHRFFLLLAPLATLPATGLFLYALLATRPALRLLQRLLYAPHQEMISAADREYRYAERITLLRNNGQVCYNGQKVHDCCNL